MGRSKVCRVNVNGMDSRCDWQQDCPIAVRCWEALTSRQSSQCHFFTLPRTTPICRTVKVSNTHCPLPITFWFLSSSPRWPVKLHLKGVCICMCQNRISSRSISRHGLAAAPPKPAVTLFWGQTALTRCLFSGTSELTVGAWCVGWRGRRRGRVLLTSCSHSQTGVLRKTSSVTSTQTEIH